MNRVRLALVVLAVLAAGSLTPVVADAQDLEHQVEAALGTLYETTPAARELGARAKGILVFPWIARDNYSALGLQSGYGILLREGRNAGYFYTSSAIYGMQAGVLPFGYALFLMSDAALQRLDQRGGWEVGKDLGVEILPSGTARAPEVTTDAQGGTMDATSGTMSQRPKVQADTFAFIIGETSLMTGVGKQGWSIVKANP